MIVRYGEGFVKMFIHQINKRTVKQISVIKFIVSITLLFRSSESDEEKKFWYLISIVLDDVKENGQAPGADVQLAGVDDAGELE